MTRNVNVTFEDAKKFYLQQHEDGRGQDELFLERLPSGIEILSDIEVHGRSAPHRELKAGSNADSNAHRLELIESVRAGKQIELMVKRARTYRQSKGYKNRNYLRFHPDKLDTIAPSFKGQPFLLNHDQYDQASRKGTILSSQLETDDRGMSSFYMGFSVVKPDAVISVLDGTIDRFSIGWFMNGAVLCTAHKVDVRSKESCYCWPGDVVEVDGKQLIAEYEYQDATGKEVSAVNSPAVTGTRIEEYRAALSAIHSRRPRPMAGFPKLAAALKLPALTDADEDQAVSVIQTLSTRALEAELQVRQLTADVATLTADRDRLRRETELASASAMDALIEDAYKAGKLAYGKDADGKNTPDALESMLRDFGKAKGREALGAKLVQMRATVPVGQRVLTDEIKQPPKSLAATDDVDAALQELSRNTGLPIDQLRARRAAMQGARR